MTIESIFQSRAATLALLLAMIAVAAAGRRACGDEAVRLAQPITSLVVTAVNQEEASPPSPQSVAQPDALAVQTPVTSKQRPAATAPFTPHYLCLCPPYCGKPMPCVDCYYKCCPDCYCAKPMPCPNPCYECTCDDYCAKPMPCNFPQPLCGPRGTCRQSEPCPLYAPWPARGPCLWP